MLSEYKLLQLKTIADARGGLVAIENNIHIPFEIKRVYYLYGTQKGVRRGYHAHKKLRQLVICLSGQCKFYLDDGKNTEIIQLDSVSKALYMSGLVWHEMFDFSGDCVLLVLADELYDEGDYIRSYHEFLKLARE